MNYLAEFQEHFQLVLTNYLHEKIKYYFHKIKDILVCIDGPIFNFSDSFMP